MPLDPAAERFLQLFAAAGEGPAAATPQGRRDALAGLARVQRGPAPAVGATADAELPGPAGPIPVRRYDPGARAESPPPLMLYFHGGGWTAGDLDTHDGVCRRLCEASGAVVLSVGYRLAPEHPFPAGWDDAWAALVWVALHARMLGVDPQRIGLAGDSAGGAIAAATALRARDAGGPPVALLLLICPILDIGRESPSRRAFARGHFIEAATVAQDLAWTLPPGADPADPRLSPLRAGSLKGLPPTLVHAAEFDPFRDEGLAFAEAITAAGGRADATVHPGMIHFFYALPRMLPYANHALAEIGRQARATLG